MGRLSGWLAAFVVGVVTVGPALGPASAAADSGPLESENWAGYALVGGPFGGVRARWVQPSASCRPGHRTYSSFWVGLGGYTEKSRHLEQIGTELDCTRSGRLLSYAWYELLPRVGQRVRLVVRPGDRVEGAVQVRGAVAVLTLVNLSRGGVARVRARVDEPDLGSAEWIAEAPTACLRPSCKVLPLAHFSPVSFEGAEALNAAGTWLRPFAPGVDPVALALVSDGRTLAYPSPIPTGEGGDFAVARR